MDDETTWSRSESKSVQRQTPLAPNDIYSPLGNTDDDVRYAADGSESIIAPSEYAPSSIVPPSYASVRQQRQDSRLDDESEYMKALRAWAEEKKYVTLTDSNHLKGFYGEKTLHDYAGSPREKKKKIDGRRQSEVNRKTIPEGRVHEPGDEAEDPDAPLDERSVPPHTGRGRRRRRSSLKTWLRRMSTSDGASNDKMPIAAGEGSRLPE